MVVRKPLDIVYFSCRIEPGQNYYQLPQLRFFHEMSCFSRELRRDIRAGEGRAGGGEVGGGEGYPKRLPLYQTTIWPSLADLIFMNKHNKYQGQLGQTFFLLLLPFKIYLNSCQGGQFLAFYYPWNLLQY